MIGKLQLIKSRAARAGCLARFTDRHGASHDPANLAGLDDLAFLRARLPRRQHHQRFGTDAVCRQIAVFHRRQVTDQQPDARIAGPAQRCRMAIAAQRIRDP